MLWRVFVLVCFGCLFLLDHMYLGREKADSEDKMCILRKQLHYV